jgi:hypothetical protein
LCSGLLAIAALFATTSQVASAVSELAANSSALERVITMPVDGSILISPQGQVAEFQSNTPLSEALREKLDRNVLQWRFKATGDNPLVGTRVELRVVLAATQDDDGYSVKIENVLFPGKADPKATASEPAPAITGKLLQAPKFPGNLQRASVSGTVLLAILVGADGLTERVVPVQSMLFDVSGRDKVLTKAIQEFEKSAVAAAKRWTYNVAPARGALPASARTVMVPVAFTLDVDDSPAPGIWQTVVRAPKQPIEWMQDVPGVQHIGVSDVGAGEMIPAVSFVQLSTDVIGKTLL